MKKETKLKNIENLENLIIRKSLKKRYGNFIFNYSEADQKHNDHQGYDEWINTRTGKKYKEAPSWDDTSIYDANWDIHYDD